MSPWLSDSKQWGTEVPAGAVTNGPKTRHCPVARRAVLTSPSSAHWRAGALAGDTPCLLFSDDLLQHCGVLVNDSWIARLDQVESGREDELDFCSG